MSLSGILRVEHQPQPDGSARVRVFYLAHPVDDTPVDLDKARRLRVGGLGTLIAGGGLALTGVALGIGALATALTGMKLKSLADEDTVTHNGFYGDRCQKGDYRLCSFDVSVINHQLDQADALGNASIGLLVGAVVLGGGGAALILTAPKAPKPRPADEHGSPPPPSASMGCGLTGGLGFTCAGQF